MTPSFDLLVAVAEMVGVFIVFGALMRIPPAQLPAQATWARTSRAGT